MRTKEKQKGRHLKEEIRTLALARYITDQLVIKGNQSQMPVAAASAQHRFAQMPMNLVHN